jgi:hypothetical protein
VRPSKDDCVFHPPRVSFYEPGRSLPNENFTGFCGTIYQIQGRILTAGEDPVKGAAILVWDEGGTWNNTVVSDSAGAYLIGSLVPGYTYFVRPSLAGYAFDPAQRRYENLNQDFTEQDFAATRL